MTIKTFAAAALAGVVAVAAAGDVRAAADPEQCREITFAEVSWTDIAATTGLATTVLETMGYQPVVSTVSVPVTFIGLDSGETDVFLGLWMPSMKSMVSKYFEKGSIDDIRINLRGAKYTLAVPAYVYEAGVKDFADLDAHRDKFGGKIYGIEPGNDGNLLIQKMIDQDAFGLGDWQLVESSEAGMLLQAKGATAEKDWIVFLGWAPHPMNTKMEIRYLSGGDDYFGPNKGGANVHTLTRDGYVDECPNVGRFLKQLEFTLDLENRIMADIMDNGAEPKDAAKTYLKAHPEHLEPWLDGVVTVDGKPALPVVKAKLGIE